jgi:hypothetical protein
MEHTLNQLLEKHGLLSSESENPLVEQVLKFIEELRSAGEYTLLPKERDQLRYMLSYWCHYMVQLTGIYPNDDLHPWMGKRQTLLARLKTIHQKRR